jgi:hypothetical protein
MCIDGPGCAYENSNGITNDSKVFFFYCSGRLILRLAETFNVQLPFILPLHLSIPLQAHTRLLGPGRPRPGPKTSSVQFRLTSWNMMGGIQDGNDSLDRFVKQSLQPHLGESRTLEIPV